MVPQATTQRTTPTPETLNRARRDYLLGRGAIHCIADTYGINAKGLAQRAYTEKWVQLREKYAHFEPVLKLIDQIRDVDTRIDELIQDKPKDQLASPDELTLGENYAKDLDCLCRAKQRLFSMLWGITGHPKPPTAKPPKERNVAKEKMMRALSEPDTKPGKRKGKKVDQPVNNQAAPQPIDVPSSGVDEPNSHTTQ